ncbi:diguanylate cyclase/phosphodiesterase with PAS/PAC and GAF sensor(s) [Caballeronia temeraria]|uniref:Diguanylate cyclase/phosphodiesterase with PAS/PAC and GAF sensor(S) n=1 Tax=Caballeronia temeraria TaxID=1777137 RepID=A0A158B677_9BURK|nr:EAL domain-containing protein [Caballeronia temeraria]SAK65572.1 diguanylate cyclase/phosphodiesterase with PAS/PAC and GAF sensor(s) [Caballeronia temeraria]
MTRLLSRGLLVNIAVVLAALGANAFVACERIGGLRESDARTLRSMSLLRDLAAYRSTLGESLTQLSRFEATGVADTDAGHQERVAHLDALESGLRAQFAMEPGMTGSFDALAARAAVMRHDADLAFARTKNARPGESRAWADATFVTLGEDQQGVDEELAAMRARIDNATIGALDQSAQASSGAMLLLVFTMLAGSAVLIYLFASHERQSREKLGVVRARQRSNERFRGMFEAHPVPMWIVDRETMRFVAVNQAAIEHFGFNEPEFMNMTLRDLHHADDFDSFAARLARSGGEGGERGERAASRQGSAGVWRYRCKDGSIVGADVSHHSLNYSNRPGIFMLANDVTDRIHAEAEARRSNEMLEAVIDNIPQRVFWKDRELRYLGCNNAFARDAGLAYNEQVIGKTDYELPWGGLADVVRADDEEVIVTTVPKMHYERDIVMGDQLRTVVTSKLPLLDGEGQTIGVLGSYHDVTDRKRAELALRLQSRALDASVNAILITGVVDGANVIEYANAAFKRITGYDPSEVIGQDCRFLHGPDGDQEGLTSIRRALAANMEASVVVRNYRKDGALFWNQLFVAPVPDAQGMTTHHIGIINDVTDLMRYQEELEYQANYDTLTRLPNRNLLKDRLQHAIETARRRESKIAVVFMDLDGFKNVNDSLGHSVGDRLLAVIGERLARSARSSDTVARHGGDEFVVVLTDITDEAGLIVWMERTRAAISEPVWLDDTELYVGCSMGASLYPQDGDDAETVMKKADLAMYRAKDMGRNNYQFYQPEMNASVGARMNLERRLRRALRDGEFLLHYQPQVDMSTRQIVGIEALVRWHDPEQGLVSPASFIPVAEESGLIGPLSEWVLREACRQNKAWQDAGLPPARVSVNLSARHFQQRDIARLVTSVLDETGLAPRYLELELTESAIMRNAEEAITMLSELSALGIGIAIDDFGTGYSSLSYLKRFPVHRLKIDRSFVADIGSSGDDETITSAIIALAHSLELQVIAEGVETHAQHDFLRERDCDEMQGYLFSRPMPHEAIPGLLQQGVLPH